MRQGLRSATSRGELAGVEQHSLVWSGVLHLLPGVFVLGAYVLSVPVVQAVGLPALMASYLAIGLALVPLELGFLVVTARRSGTTLWELLPFRRGLGVRSTLPLVLLALAWQATIYFLLVPSLDRFFLGVSPWVPDILLLPDTEDLRTYTGGSVALTLAAGLLLNGVVGPVVEELYFRGYLLPRIARFGAPAVALNALLFSLYHFFTPWQVVGRFLFALPLSVIAWRTRSVYSSITVHVLNNLFSTGLLLVAFATPP